MSNTYAQVNSATVVDFVARAEARLLRLAGNAVDESVVRDVAEILQDLSRLRMNVEAPGIIDKRMNARMHERSMAYVTLTDGRRLEAALWDVSVRGALIACDEPLNAGEPCSLLVPGIDKAVSAQVYSITGDMTHIVFDELDYNAMVDLAKHVERVFSRY